MEAAGAGSALPSGLPLPHAAELSPWFGEDVPQAGLQVPGSPQQGQL